MFSNRAKVGLFDELIFRFFGRLIARQFVVFGGVTAALKRGEYLLRRGIVPTYNRIDEHVCSRFQINQILASYLEIIARMDYTNRGNIAIKPSALGIDFGPFFFARMLQRLIDAAAGKYIEIEIDAESRETLATVQHILNALAQKLPDGVVLRPAFQMHLPDEVRRKLIDECHILDMPVRIVKGSGLYNVGEAELSDEEVLKRYYDTFREQIDAKRCPSVATVRDAKLLRSLTDIAESEQVPAHKFAMQFLDGPFGWRLSRKYAQLGYRVGCYVAFVDPSAPDEWKGYVKRRIAFGRKLLFGK